MRQPLPKCVMCSTLLERCVVVGIRRLVVCKTNEWKSLEVGISTHALSDEEARWSLQPSLTKGRKEREKTRGQLEA